MELACWLIERYDGLRASVASRASIIVSADALLLTGMTFLLGDALSALSQYSSFVKMVLFASICSGFILISLSAVHATNAIAFVWRRTKKSVDFSIPPRPLFFAARDTSESFDDIEDFEQAFKNTSEESMLHYALAELLLIAKIHQKRYKNFRRSMQLLTVALMVFLISVAALFTRLI